MHQNCETGFQTLLLMMTPLVGWSQQTKSRRPGIYQLCKGFRYFRNRNSFSRKEKNPKPSLCNWIQTCVRVNGKLHKHHGSHIFHLWNNSTLKTGEICKILDQPQYLLGLWCLFEGTKPMRNLQACDIQLIKFSSSPAGWKLFIKVIHQMDDEKGVLMKPKGVTLNKMLETSLQPASWPVSLMWLAKRHNCLIVVIKRTLSNTCNVIVFCENLLLFFIKTEKCSRNIFTGENSWNVCCVTRDSSEKNKSS